jgi:hypothetical protein
MHKVEGWILEYDPTIGGAEVQAVIGVVHARRGRRTLRARSLTASEWLLHESPDADPTARAAGFADRLNRILAFNGVVPDR